jgi:hypothetical protein
VAGTRRICGLARSRPISHFADASGLRAVPFASQNGGNMNNESVSAEDVLTDEAAEEIGSTISRLSVVTARMPEQWVDRRSRARSNRRTAGLAPRAPADRPIKQRTYITCDLVNPPIGITSKSEFHRWIEAQDFQVPFRSRSPFHQDGKLLTLHLACRAYGPIGIEVQVAGFIVTIEAEFHSSGSDVLAARVL